MLHNLSVRSFFNVALQFIVALLVILGMQSSTRAQDPPIPDAQPTTANNGSLRTVYITAIAKNGNLITDLTSTEFSIEKAGQPLQVVELSSALSVPIFIGLLVDSSGSERANPARHQNLQSLANFLGAALTQSNEALLVDFDDETRLLTKMTGDRALLRAGFNLIVKRQPRGSSAVYDAIIAAVQQLASGEDGRKIVIAYTDFEDNTSRHTLEKTVTLMEHAQASIFPLIKLDASSRNQRKALRAAQSLADKSGGMTFTFSTPADLDKSLNDLLTLLHNSFILKYQCVPAATSKKSKPQPPRIILHRPGIRLLETIPSPAACP